MARMFRTMFSMGAALAVAGPVLAADAAKPVTFTKDVAPIFQAKCQNCHEPGSIAPMSLSTFEEARPWARSIKQRVATRQMPPWHIDRSVGVQKFKNDMSLTDEQVQTIVDWVDQGALQGNPADMPPPKPVATTLFWQGERDGYGAPDLIVKSPEYTMPAVSQDRGGARCPTSRGSPSRAGCGWSKSGRPTSRAARSCTTRSPISSRSEQPDPDAVDRGTASGRRAGRDDAAASSTRRRQLMEWAIGKGYDRYPRRHRQADQAGPEDLLGPARPRRPARKSRPAPKSASGSTRKARSRSIAAT